LRRDIREAKKKAEEARKKAISLRVELGAGTELEKAAAEKEFARDESIETADEKKALKDAESTPTVAKVEGVAD